ncbi:MAG: hypothetical protein RIQ81_1323 [Pseudomonadota bacterium]|jgi:hypothetical protein
MALWNRRSGYLAYSLLIGLMTAGCSDERPGPKQQQLVQGEEESTEEEGFVVDDAQGSMLGLTGGPSRTLAFPFENMFVNPLAGKGQRTAKTEPFTRQKFATFSASKSSPVYNYAADYETPRQRSDYLGFDIVGDGTTITFRKPVINITLQVLHKPGQFPANLMFLVDGKAQPFETKRQYETVTKVRLQIPNGASSVRIAGGNEQNSHLLLDNLRLTFLPNSDSGQDNVPVTGGGSSSSSSTGSTGGEDDSLTTSSTGTGSTGSSTSSGDGDEPQPPVVHPTTQPTPTPPPGGGSSGESGQRQFAIVYETALNAGLEILANKEETDRICLNAAQRLFRIPFSSPPTALIFRSGQLATALIPDMEIQNISGETVAQNRHDFMTTPRFQRQLYVRTPANVITGFDRQTGWGKDCNSWKTSGYVHTWSYIGEEQIRECTHDQKNQAYILCIGVTSSSDQGGGTATGGQPTSSSGEQSTSATAGGGSGSTGDQSQSSSSSNPIAPTTDGGSSTGEQNPEQPLPPPGEGGNSPDSNGDNPNVQPSYAIAFATQKRLRLDAIRDPKAVEEICRVEAAMAGLKFIAPPIPLIVRDENTGLGSLVPDLPIKNLAGDQVAANRQTFLEPGNWQAPVISQSRQLEFMLTGEKQFPFPGEAQSNCNNWTQTFGSDVTGRMPFGMIQRRGCFELDRYAEGLPIMCIGLMQ